MGTAHIWRVPYVWQRESCTFFLYDSLWQSPLPQNRMGYVLMSTIE